MTPRQRFWFVVLSAGLMLTVAGLAMSSGPFLARAADEPSEKEKPKAKAPPPLESDEEPLLLTDPAKSARAPTSTHRVADNDACFVCHVNFREESLAARHQANAVGCVDCHGSSEAHRNDENNITPPDVMFSPATLDTACRKCHKMHNIPARKVVARFLKRNPNPTALGRDVVCTDCHGEHHLAHRTVRWDRQTRQLLSEPKR